MDNLKKEIQENLFQERILSIELERIKRIGDDLRRTLASVCGHEKTFNRSSIEVCNKCGLVKEVILESKKK